jgi:negative regulator of genetic competence, sporulation and motility
MAEFKTINYTRFVCTKCHIETVIEPGQLFDGVMNCKCKKEDKPKLDLIEKFGNDVEELVKDIKCVDLTAEDIKAKYNMDELRALGKALKVKGYHSMKEDNLVARLLEKAK